MIKYIKAIFAAISITALVLSLSACNGGEKPADTAPSVPPTVDSVAAPSYAPAEDSVATLIADFRNGSVEPNQREIPWTYEGPCDIGMLSNALSAATGLDFFVDWKIEGGKAYVAWWDRSALVKGLDEREQNEDFFFYDAVSLNWFMLDSMTATIKKNIPEVTEVYYSGENGEPVIFTNPEDMAEQGLYALPVDLAYENSAFYVAHAGGRGDVDGDNDDGLAYWNGFDFGPNLSYAEEYEMQGDPGEYMNPAEAAKLAFDGARLNGYIPGYSDDTEYMMTLVDLADIDGEECYVYRCEGESFAAGLACAYKISDVYMQGQMGQWVRLDIGDGDQ